MTKCRKRRIWLVSDYGGEYEDAWERQIRAFTSAEMAETCAKKREERRADEDDCWDYLGTYCKEVELIDEVEQ